MSDVPDDHEVDPYHAVVPMSDMRRDLDPRDVDAMSMWCDSLGPEWQRLFAEIDRRDPATLEKLACEAKARADAATEGPWGHKAGAIKHYVFSPDEREDFGFSQQIHHWKDGHEVPAEANCIFVAHARTDVPVLADAVLRLLEENKRLKARLLEEMAKTDPVAQAIVNAPVVPGKVTDEEREEVAAAADGPWIPHEQVMAELRARRESAPSDDDEPSVGDVHGYGGAK